MIYKDIAEYEEADSQLAISTITKLHIEIDRLNNIINELEEHIRTVVYHDIYGERIIDSILNKLQELKGSDKSEK